MPLVYKYISPDRIDNTPRPIVVLNSMRISATDPRFFNDPFEVRPWFDQERHEHAARTQEAFDKMTMGIEHSLIKGRSMADIPTDKAAGFAEHLNKRFRDELGRRYRIMCLAKNPKSVLMWGHYTDSHKGVVIGIDPETPGFVHGLNTGGFEVTYSKDRSDTKLPIAYYQSPSVEIYNPDGSIANHPHEEVLNGRIVIPFHEYQRQVDQAVITAMTTKAEDWAYEREVRFIYELPKHGSSLVAVNGRHYVQIPPEALREVIIGFRANIDLVRGIVQLYREGRIGKPKLFYSDCHPNVYEVQPHETNDKYLLDYFEIVLPNS